jgi:hypothetical protein
LVWKKFIETVYNDEYEMENKILGDIDYRADTTDNFVSFFDFNFSEVKNRYQCFLNLTIDSTENDSGQKNEDELENKTDFDAEYLTDLSEKDDNGNDKPEETEIKKEVKEIEDLSYWKPVIDFNIEEMISELLLDK